ncbi:O-antigen ligase family protein [Flavobacterium sp. N2820]|uniref:O-antigen ligase family protein n=1 Tax=Flavobacterium sp. N2820 TaxID=2986834 RepID=UPI0022258BB6|nr:O-antigen ligase family protein [Flavobacterium sp. N2820]
MNEWLIRKKVFRFLVLFFLLISIYLYFSRTMLVVFFVMGFSLLGYAKITVKTLKFIGIAVVSILVLYAYLFSVKLDRNAKGAEAFLYKIKIAPEEIFKSKIDRNNHKELWDHWRGYEAKRAIYLMEENPTSYFIGTGFGSLVNLKFQAPVGGEGGMKYISRLHNGYIFVLYKTGILGLLLYFVFLTSLYMKIYRFNTNNSNQILVNRLISSIGLFYIFTTLIISGIYIPRDAVVFVLGGLLSFNTLKSNTKM